MLNETILNVFPSDDETKRLVIACEQSESERGRLVLRQESFAEDVGWFVQSRIQIEPEQIPGLKMSLSTQNLKRVRPPASRFAAAPSILRFERSAAVQAG